MPALVARADGSSEADAVGRVVIDRADPLVRWRFVCPNGHVDWDPTNNHIWCAACAQLHGVQPEYWELFDKKTGETVPWAAVELR
ncbi:hypothetical protein ACFQPA_13670 [Halomarina halobia]|uniref:Uncharacterized protein n=1 Tax=Halomarina halobia TaxID=3033386 RepID=A0ABD6A988_9EURY|nr:hypothetical protein [Halomarina sp. PSR21]